MGISSRKAFSLIELMMVIAIISVLSAVVLTSLSSARERSANASIKSNLSSVRGMIALYYDTNSNYGTASVNGCASGGMFNATTPHDISGAISQALAQSGHTGGVYCRSNVTTNQWAIAIPLRPLTGNTATQKGWCIDYRGVSKQIIFNSSNFSTSQCP